MRAADFMTRSLFDVGFRADICGGHYRGTPDCTQRFSDSSRFAQSSVTLDSMSDRQSTAAMLGEFLCEAAVLVAVFAPLDRLLRHERLTLGEISIIVAMVVGLLSTGIAVERRRT